MDPSPHFDYANFARPWNYSIENTAGTSDWFSSQFFAALRETDLAYSPPSQTWATGNYDLVNYDIFSIQDLHNSRQLSHYLLNEGADTQWSNKEVATNTEANLSMEESLEISSGQISRVASPPNESSHEDRLPFAWDPKSNPIARAKPVILAAEDPLFASIDPSVKIAQATLSRIRDFLTPRDQLDGDDIFTMPGLDLVNIFVSLFFSKFLPQAPVLHRPTLDIESLPPALLSIVMVIGSCYSRLRNTRRFGIIVLDRIRQNLLAMIENDNGLMREPMVIYATALVCYMGLWCGNKRAFELSEALRSVVVTYVRRLPNTTDHHEHSLQNLGRDSEHGHVSSAAHSKRPTIDSQWRLWIAQEGRKRLRWFVYMIDMQFPSILGMGSMLTTADVRRWECPCDESFWALTAARSWRNRLGSASEPACSVFGSLVALISSTTTSNTTEMLLPSLNAWSANLLLTAIMSEVFHYQDTLVVLRTYSEDATMPVGSLDGIHRADHLRTKLEAWSSSYRHQQISRLDPTSAHLNRCSMMMYHLARLYLVFPIFDIQDCLGRSGPASTRAAMKRLSSWMAQHPQEASRVVEDASICISIVMCNEGESDPHDIIGLFLCHVVIWSIANTATSYQKDQAFRTLCHSSNISSSLLEVVEAGFSPSGADGSIEFDAPQLIFRHAIHALVRLGDWGASANLALLLHLHPGRSSL